MRTLNKTNELKAFSVACELKTRRGKSIVLNIFLERFINSTRPVSLDWMMVDDPLNALQEGN